jgi:hypothetical protein
VTYRRLALIAWFVFWKKSFFGVVVTPIDFSCVFSPITSAGFEVWLAPSGHSAVTLATVRSSNESWFLVWSGAVRFLVWVYWIHPMVKKYMRYCSSSKISTFDCMTNRSGLNVLASGEFSI